MSLWPMIRWSLIRRMATPYLTLSALALLAAGCAARQPSPPPMPGAPAPAAPRAQPNYLGMSAAALRQTMGAPAFVRKDGASEIWRYDGAACRAFFFLYDAKDAKDTKTGKAVRYV